MLSLRSEGLVSLAQHPTRWDRSNHYLRRKSRQEGASSAELQLYAWYDAAEGICYARKVLPCRSTNPPKRNDEPACCYIACERSLEVEKCSTWVLGGFITHCDPRQQRYLPQRPIGAAGFP